MGVKYSGLACGGMRGRSHLVGSCAGSRARHSCRTSTPSLFKAGILNPAQPCSAPTSPRLWITGSSTVRTGEALGPRPQRAEGPGDHAMAASCAPSANRAPRSGQASFLTEPTRRLTAFPNSEPCRGAGGHQGNQALSPNLVQLPPVIEEERWLKVTQGGARMGIPPDS